MGTPRLMPCCRRTSRPAANNACLRDSPSSGAAARHPLSAMTKLAAVAALVAAATASEPPKGAGAGAAFRDSRLITPAQGVLLNSWANQTAGQEWELCYTSFTMDKKTPAEFHKGCDQYKPTVTVAHNAGGRPGRCEARCEFKFSSSSNPPCKTIGSDCSTPGDGPGTCAGQCSTSGGCAKIGEVCGPTNPGNFTFGGYVRVVPALKPRRSPCWF